MQPRSKRIARAQKETREGDREKPWVERDDLKSDNDPGKTQTKDNTTYRAKTMTARIKGIKRVERTTPSYLAERKLKWLCATKLRTHLVIQ